MSCQNCNKDRIVSVNAKCSDMFSASQYVSKFELQSRYNGYVPEKLGIGKGDYIKFAYCMDCGMIQNNAFPLKLESIAYLDLKICDKCDEEFPKQYMAILSTNKPPYREVWVCENCKPFYLSINKT